jgi:hypothetical protein
LHLQAWTFNATHVSHVARITIWHHHAQPGFFLGGRRGLNSGPTPSPALPALGVCVCVFSPKTGSLRTISPGWLRTTILLISASQAAKVTGVSHRHPAGCFYFFFVKSFILAVQKCHGEFFGVGNFLALLCQSFLIWTLMSLGLGGFLVSSCIFSQSVLCCCHRISPMG